MKPTTFETIKRAVSEYMNVTEELMIGGRRTTLVVEARCVLAAVCRKLRPEWSWPDIARMIGYQSHSSALDAANRADKRHIMNVVAKIEAAKPAKANNVAYQIMWQGTFSRHSTMQIARTFEKRIEELTAADFRSFVDLAVRRQLQEVR